MNYVVGMLERRYCFWAQRVNASAPTMIFRHRPGDRTMLTRFCRAALALRCRSPPCRRSGRRRANAKKMTLVQMHPIMGVGEEIFLYAVPKHLGYFEAEGLDVDIQNTQTGMISAQLLQSGNAQVGTTAADAIMPVREQGGDLISFFNLKRNPGTFLVVLPDSPIQKLEDLKGKTIGAPSFGAGGGLALEGEPDARSASRPISTPQLRPAPALRRSRR